MVMRNSSAQKRRFEQLAVLALAGTSHYWQLGGREESGITKSLRNKMQPAAPHSHSSARILTLHLK
jgi:hypothetical protein